ncbi:hypothetical protein AD006_01145 [Pseudonocardia sp. EC080610-09]|uniref:hypothetical protein n=1 Tax=unclassified Pseudonocardia TaxID=2619320 RepID=UPI0007058B8F|nr:MULTISPECIES: hypothetical protein [unclassified Pseudonocardia]ALL74273.1 hypothetical protein AD006_01145 [Pseudonocardia sp. EC080610-09]ALL81296.1 hypothetical protein AD017_08970 [Pseudonocardia sp. EC080619-01]
MDDMTPELLERLVRMETKLDHILMRIDGHEVRISKLEDRVPDPDHESRIRKLEKAVWIASGIAAAAGGTLGSLIAPVLGA